MTTRQRFSDFVLDVAYASAILTVVLLVAGIIGTTAGVMLQEAAPIDSVDGTPVALIGSGLVYAWFMSPLTVAIAVATAAVASMTRGSPARALIGGLLISATVISVVVASTHPARASYVVVLACVAPGPIAVAWLLVAKGRPGFTAAVGLVLGLGLWYGLLAMALLVGILAVRGSHGAAGKVAVVGTPFPVAAFLADSVRSNSTILSPIALVLGLGLFAIGFLQLRASARGATTPSTSAVRDDGA